MPRNNPPATPIPDKAPQRVGYVTQTREYELITPLFGGGVEPAQADPVTVVRATEIRGHLRFWWRGTRGGQFDGDLQKMKEAEAALWGAASTKEKPGVSKVQIVVIRGTKGSEAKPFQIFEKENQHGRKVWRVRTRDSSKVPAYVAFPLQPTEKELRERTAKEKPVWENVTFTLKITYPKVTEPEVQAALWAWETFGGVGARTRRGFGALRCKSIEGDLGIKQVPTLPRRAEVCKTLKKLLQDYVSGGSWPDNVPHLSQQLKFKVVGTSNRNPQVAEAWAKLVLALSDFRQKRYDGKLGKGRGRSQWPEPDAIREITSRRDGAHPTRRSRLNKFPRAAFGLPIIFHFNLFQNPGDPYDVSLQPSGYDRLSSPLILRPMLCEDGAVGLAVVLETPIKPLHGLELVDAKHQRNPNLPKTGLDSQIDTPEVSDVPPLKGQPDVLQAFLDTL